MGFLYLIFIATLGFSYEDLSPDQKASLISNAKSVCDEILENAKKNGDTRLLEAQKRHCTQQPQLSGLIGAFYHLDVDLGGKDPVRSLYYKTMFARLALITKLTPDYVTPAVKWQIDDTVSELSGLAFDQKPNDLWMNGDSGTGTFIGKVNVKSGDMTRIRVTGAKNRDWEALVIDSKDNLWVLDVGDNKKIRDSVQFYRVNPSTIKNKTVKAEKFDLSYSEGQMDCEAAVILDDVIYLFEKSYFLNPRVYSVDLKSQPMKAKLEGVLPQIGLITDANLTSEGRLLILTYQGLSEVSNWRDAKKRSIKTVIEKQWGQVEALVAQPGKKTVWIGREDGKIFEVPLP